MADEPLTVTADVHQNHGRWEVHYDAPGVPVALTAEVRELEDAETLVAAVVATLTGRPDDSIAVEIVLDTDVADVQRARARARSVAAYATTGVIAAAALIASIVLALVALAAAT